MPKAVFKAHYDWFKHVINFLGLCERLSQGNIAGVVDMAWGGWIRGRKAAVELGLPYIRFI